MKSLGLLILGLGLLSALASTAMAAESGTFSGDFRLRHQWSQSETRRDRHRDRMRLRLNTQFTVEEKLKFVFRLASGESGDTALSTNQSFDDAGENKAIWIDLAYLKFEWDENREVRAGKYANNWWAPKDHQMVFDDDYTPEGAALTWNADANKMQPFATLQAQWLNERDNPTAPQNSSDIGLIAGQFGFKTRQQEQDLDVAIGAVIVTNLRGAPSLRTNGFGGNSSMNVGGTDYYSKNYDLLTLGAEWTNRAWSSRPIVISAEGVNNTRVHEQAWGWMAGASYGSTEKVKDWILSYRYRMIEKDAIVGGLSDSDVFQAADARGHIVIAKYATSEKTVLGLTAYFYESGLAAPTWGQRFHLDFGVKF